MRSFVTFPLSRELIEDSWSGDNKAYLMYQLSGLVPTQTIDLDDRSIAVPDYAPLFHVMEQMYHEAHREATRRLSPLEAIKRVLSR